MLIKFYCDHCEAKIEAEAILGGDEVVCPNCEASLVVPMDVVGPRCALGPFRILEELGEGGMGRVFLADQMSLNRLVALKVLSPALTRNEEFVGNFMREIQCRARSTTPISRPRSTRATTGACTTWRWSTSTGATWNPSSRSADGCRRRKRSALCGRWPRG